MPDISIEILSGVGLMIFLYVDDEVHVCASTGKEYVLAFHPSLGDHAM
jgi:hypothetical protein